MTVLYSAVAQKNTTDKTFTLSDVESGVRVFQQDDVDKDGVFDDEDEELEFDDDEEDDEEDDDDFFDDDEEVDGADEDDDDDDDLFDDGEDPHW